MKRKGTGKPRNIRNITERKLTAEAAKKLDQQNRTMVDYSSDLIWMLDKRGNFTFFNRRAEELSGYKRADWLGKSFVPLIVHGELPRVMRVFKSVIRGKTHQYEVSVHGKDGSILMLSVNTTPVLENGKVIGTISFGQDITARKKAENSLDESESRFRGLFEASAVGMIMTDLNAQFMLVNQAACNILGYTRYELLTKTFSDITYLENTNSPTEGIKKLLAGHIDYYHAERRYIHKKGNFIWVHLTMSLARDADYKPMYFIGQFHDISERKRAEDLLRIQHDLAVDLSSAVDLTEALQYIMDAALQVGDIDSGGIYVVDSSNGALDLVFHRGLSDEFVKHVAHLEADAPSTQLIKSGKPVYAQHSDIAKKMDEPRKKENLRAMAVVPIFYGSKVIAALNLASHKSDSINQDSRTAIEAIAAGIGGVIDRIQTHDKLSASERALADAQNIAHLGSWEYDTAAKKRRWSNEMFNIFGRAQHLGEPSWPELEKMVHPDDWKSLYNAMQSAIKDGTPYSLEFRIIRPDDKITWAVTIGKTLQDAQGRVLKLQGTVQDISEHKKDEAEKAKLQAQLLQAQKLESIGTLTGGIAHDFNNIITATQGFTELARMDTSPASPAFEHLNQALNASKRAAEFTRQLLLFSRKQLMHMKALSLNDAVIGIHNMFKGLMGEYITVALEMALDAWPVKADKSNIEQVIMNLMLNARDAMPQGGKITIKTENADVTEADIGQMPESRPGRFVCLSVSDTGSGISPDVMPQIFEPFFTTKEAGQSSGLGLAVVYGIVKQHNGWINVRSRTGKGSDFRIYLPVTDEKPQAETPEAPQPQVLMGNGERILVVEDELVIKDLLTKMLTNNGYQVSSARDAYEAIEIFDREKGNFQMVFSDVVIPGESGFEVVKKLITRKPAIKVLLTSGYTDYKARREDIDAYQLPFIQKPYTIPELLKTIKDICRQE